MAAYDRAASVDERVAILRIVQVLEMETANEGTISFRQQGMVPCISVDVDFYMMT